MNGRVIKCINRELEVEKNVINNPTPVIKANALFGLKEHINSKIWARREITSSTDDIIK